MTGEKLECFGAVSAVPNSSVASPAMPPDNLGILVPGAELIENSTDL